MRFFKSMAALMLVLSFTFTFTACGEVATATEAAVETADNAVETIDTAIETTLAAPHGEGKEHTSAYVCPMHCADSGSEEAGECPTCGMAYIAQAEHTENGHKH